jgi:hypothetical protein
MTWRAPSLPPTFTASRWTELAIGGGYLSLRAHGVVGARALPIGHVVIILYELPVLNSFIAYAVMLVTNSKERYIS